MSLLTPALRRLLAIAAVAAMVFASSPVDAQTYPTVEPDDTDTEELAELVREVLEELGVEPEVVRTILDDLLDGVAEHIDALIDEGVVTIDQVETLADLVEDGAFDEIVPQHVEQTRERRDAFRSAAEELLADLGIEVPDGAPIHDALEEHGLSRDDLADLLRDAGFELPERPERPAPEGCEDRTYPVTGPADERRPPEPADDHHRPCGRLPDDGSGPRGAARSGDRWRLPEHGTRR